MNFHPAAYTDYVVANPEFVVRCERGGHERLYWEWDDGEPGVHRQWVKVPQKSCPGLLRLRPPFPCQRGYRAHLLATTVSNSSGFKYVATWEPSLPADLSAPEWSGVGAVEIRHSNVEQSQRGVDLPLDTYLRLGVETAADESFWVFEIQWSTAKASGLVVAFPDFGWATTYYADDPPRRVKECDVLPFDGKPLPWATHILLPEEARTGEPLHLEVHLVDPAGNRSSGWSGDVTIGESIQDPPTVYFGCDYHRPVGPVIFD